MSRMNRTLLAVLLPALVAVSGCATVMAGKRQVWQIETVPGKAQVVVDGHPVGYTPVAVNLRRNRPHQIRLFRPGCQPRVIRLRKRINGWFWLNILWSSAGIVGLIVDAVVGSMYELMPDEGSWSQGMMLHEGTKRMYLRVPMTYRCQVPAPGPNTAPPPPPAPPPPATPAPPASNRPDVNKPRQLCRSFTGQRGSRCAGRGHHVASRR